MNIKLLKKVCKILPKERHNFDMASFFMSSNCSTVKKPEKGCGSAACIAGWAIALEERCSISSYSHYEGYSEKAEKLLDLNEQQSYALFNAEVWPKEFQDRYFRAKTDKERALAAVDRIKYMIRTGK